jgi:hypothetical protein
MNGGSTEVVLQPWPLMTNSFAVEALDDGRGSRELTCNSLLFEGGRQPGNRRLMVKVGGEKKWESEGESDDASGLHPSCS